MSDPTAHDMLKFYRQQSNHFDNEQTRQFNAMPLKDRMELIFYMLVNTNKVVQLLHQRIAPGEAEIEGMPDMEKPN